MIHGRVFNVTTGQTFLAASFTPIWVYSIIASTSSRIYLTSFQIDAVGTTLPGEAHEQFLQFEVWRGFTGSLSGTALTPTPLRTKDSTSTAIVIEKDTTTYPGGVLIDAFGWNTRFPLRRYWGGDQRIAITSAVGGSGIAGIKMVTTPTTDVQYYASFTWSEY